MQVCNTHQQTQKDAHDKCSVSRISYNNIQQRCNGQDINRCDDNNKDQLKFKKVSKSSSKRPNNKRKTSIISNDIFV
uniref:Uncharacterized protein n=1 Tax=Rhizophora mucronata TaxID=61149 RepID=A0A2P2N441_RHIMU